MIVSHHTLKLIALLLLVTAGQALGQSKSIEAPHLLKDQPTDAYKLQLIDLAWQAATSYPLNPHVKNRARAEEVVVNGALAINQPHLAWGYAKKVVNWRRGACYAEIAHYLLEQEDLEHVEFFLQGALAYSRDPKQGWRHQRVKGRVAAARVLMGLSHTTEGLIESQDPANQSQKISAEISQAGEESYSEFIKLLDAMVALDGYEERLAAMNGFADLYEQNYANDQRRVETYEKIKVAWKGMPGTKRFEVMIRLVEAALRNEDKANAGKLLDETQEIFNSFRWGVDFQLTMRSEIARHRVAAGQADAAREGLEACIKIADEQLEKLQNFEQAAAFRPVAEGFAVLGDTERAHELYKRTVEIGAVNPNIRPRVRDITATCVSMATHGIEPDDNLFASIKQIVDELKTRYE